MTKINFYVVMDKASGMLKTYLLDGKMLIYLNKGVNEATRAGEKSKRKLTLTSM